MYKWNTISSIIGDYFEIDDIVSKYNKYIKKHRIFSTKYENMSDDYDYKIKQYSFILESLKEMIDDDSISERKFQNRIADILLILYPKYLFVLKDVHIKDTNGIERILDFALVDANDKDKYCACKDVSSFDKTKQKHLRLAIELFLSIDNEYDFNEVLDILYSRFNNDVFDNVESLQIIQQFLQAQLNNSISNDLLNYLLYYVYSKTSNNDRSVKYVSSVCLIELTKYHSIEDKAFKYLSTIFDSSSPEIKATIASRVKNIKNKGKYIDNLIRKAKNNSNYFVRYSVNSD